MSGSGKENGRSCVYVRLNRIFRTRRNQVTAALEKGPSTHTLLFCAVGLAIVLPQAYHATIKVSGIGIEVL